MKPKRPIIRTASKRIWESYSDPSLDCEIGGIGSASVDEMGERNEEAN